MSNLEILASFLSADPSVLENSNADILQEISSVVDAYLEGKTEFNFNSRIEQVLTEDNAHAEYLRDLIADIYFQEETSDKTKTKITLLSSSNSLLSDELELRTNLRILYLIEQRPIFKKKLQELTEYDEVAAVASAAPAASIHPPGSYFKPLSIAASVLLVVVVGYFIFRNPQQIQIAKIDVDGIAIPIYEKMMMINIGNENGIGFAGNDSTSIRDSLIVGVLNDTINAYRLWNDTLDVKTATKVDSIEVIRRVSKDSDKIYLKLNTNEYQIIETEEYLKLEQNK